MHLSGRPVSRWPLRGPGHQLVAKGETSGAWLSMHSVGLVRTQAAGSWGWMGKAARLEGEEEGSEQEQLRRGSRRFGPALRNAWTRGA